MAISNTELMAKVKELLREEVTTIGYDTWIKDLDIIEIDNNHIILSTPDPFKKESLDGKYKDLITNTFSYLTNIMRPISVVVLNSTVNEENKNYLKNNNFQHKNNSLNLSYTFETFIVGNNNSFAHAAALGVAESPGKSYNPLFIYGGVGLGKTHLMHAVGNEILKNNKEMKVLYVTSETFTNEFINSIKTQQNEQFRDKYRKIDVLMIDDIQFISKKEGVQEEFFHTFNTLHESGSQIILSSDKPPKEIPFLEERLKSRFEWGLIVDISLPDFETRVAILRKKAEVKNILIDLDILYNIASQIDSNIRELEGVLNKIIAISSLSSGPITMEMSEKAINDVILEKAQVISVDFIQETVANYFGIEKRDLKSSKRSNDLAYPRQIAMYFCRSIANFPLKQIGDDFGKRDHTTVMHAFKKIEKEIRENKNTKIIVDSIKKLILKT